MLTTVAAGRTAPRAHRGRHAATLPEETALVVVPAVLRTMPGADKRRRGGRVRAGATSGRARPVPRRALNGRVPAPLGPIAFGPISATVSGSGLRLRVVLLLRGSALASRLSVAPRPSVIVRGLRASDRYVLTSRQVVATVEPTVSSRTVAAVAASANFLVRVFLLGPPAPRSKVVREGPQAVLLFLAAVVARDSARPPTAQGRQRWKGRV